MWQKKFQLFQLLKTGLYHQVSQQEAADRARDVLLLREDDRDEALRAQVHPDVPLVQRGPAEQDLPQGTEDGLVQLQPDPDVEHRIPDVGAQLPDGRQANAGEHLLPTKWQKLIFVLHLISGTSMGWGVCSIGGDLLPVCLPSSLRRTLSTFLRSAEVAETNWAILLTF